MSKNLIYLLLAVAAVAGLAIVYVSTRQPDPIANSAAKAKFDPDRFHDTTHEERSNYVQ